MCCHIAGHCWDEIIGVGAGESVRGNVVENGSGRVLAMIVNDALAGDDWLYWFICSWLPGVMMCCCGGSLGQPCFDFVNSGG